MSIYVCIDRIENPVIRLGTKKIIDQHYETIKEAPASVSGKHHQGETMEDHLIETFAFVEMHIREFSVLSNEADLLKSAALLHDIGNSRLVEKGNVSAKLGTAIIEGEKWKYYDATGWSRDNSRADIHPILSAEIIGKNSFRGSNIISMLCMVHMSHWAEKSCPISGFLNPELRRLADILAMSDYLASQKSIKIIKGI